VLVTGGAGYIGSHAVRALVDAGHAVVVLDNLSAGHPAAVPIGVPLVRADVLDGAAVRQALAGHRIEAVMHFAAWLDVGESVREPLKYYRNNVTGALSVIDAMREAGVGCFVFSSTCATYGEPARMPIDEDADQRPINAYGETKLAVERALPHVARAHGLRWVSLRYFNAAGAHPDGTIGEDHHPEIHLIPRALQAATGGPPLRVFGEDYPTPDGTCLRDYIHVCDLAEAHVKALDRLLGGGGSMSCNVGTGTPQSVRAVIDAVGRVVGQPVRWESAPRRPGDPPMLYASSARVRHELGWQPRYPDLDTIVAHAWGWHRAHPAGYEDVGPPAT
jgi:UDP-glucose-4-epimerase GalE